MKQKIITIAFVGLVIVAFILLVACNANICSPNTYGANTGASCSGKSESDCGKAGVCLQKIGDGTPGPSSSCVAPGEGSCTTPAGASGYTCVWQRTCSYSKTYYGFSYNI